MEYESLGFVCGVGTYVPRVVITTNISLVSRQTIQISQNILPFSLLNTIFRNHTNVYGFNRGFETKRHATHEKRKF